MRLFMSGLSLVCLFFAVLSHADDAEKSEEVVPTLVSPDFRVIVREAKSKVFPSVVFVKCIKESMEYGKKGSTEVSGSGVLISSDGEILSNWHVVDKALEIRCLLYDGRAFDADVIGKDKDTDIALLKLRTKADEKPLSGAVLGDSSLLDEGDFVMAMGAPWGLSRSVSIGIVSCVRRYLPGNSEYNLWLQTDASISPGNSGGPLINTAGEVVGINAMGILIGGDTGFAVPSEVIKDVIKRLREFGRVDWSWTGLELQPLRDFNRNVYFNYDTGVMISGTAPESPARRAEIKTGDRLVRVNGHSLTALNEEDLPDIRRFLALLPKDEPAQFEFVRNEKSVNVEIAPREKGKVEGNELDNPRWDFTVKVINQFDNPDMFFYRNQGVFVYGIKSSGNARVAGLRQKDILLDIDGRPIFNLEDVQEAHAAALNGLPTKHRVIFSVLRNGQLRQVALDYSRDYSRD